MPLHTEIPLIALFRLMHLGITLAAVVRRRKLC